MAQKTAENERMAASPNPPHFSSPRLHDGVATEDSRHSSVWSEAHLSSGSQKQESTGAFDLDYGLAMKFDDQELRLDEFTRGEGLNEAEHWTRFSPAAAPLPGLAAQAFRYNGMSASPEMSETTTPPSLPGPFEDSRRGPGVRATQDELMLPPRDGFETSADDQWAHGLDEFQEKRDETHLPFQLSYSAMGTNENSSLSLPSRHTLPAPTQGYTYPTHAHSYPPLFPYSFQNTDQPGSHLGPAHQSPPATADSTSSSGSSTPFPRPNGYEPAGWKPYGSRSDGAYPSPPNGLDNRPLSHDQYHAEEWGMEANAGTCDPRGITGQHEREQEHKYATYPGMNEAGPSRYGDPMTLPNQLSQHGSPVFSDLSPPVDAHADELAPLKRGRGRPRRDPLTRPSADSYFAAPKGAASPSAYYKAKKKAGEEVLGMGWEDVDEKTLEFTSRQDTKPTRTLRRQCYNCRTWRDVSAWRRSIMETGRIVCNKCGLYEKAHKKSRPLNDRGEFVRPGKHTPKAGPKGVGRGRARAGGRSDSVVGAGVMRFETDEPTK